METAKSEDCPDESTPETRGEGPAFFLTDLAAYNSGQLAGKWVYLNELSSLEELQEVVSKFQEQRGIEEWFCSDTNFLPDLGECPNLEKMWFVHSQYEEHGQDLVNAFLDCYGLDDLTENVIAEHFQGEFESLEEYAENLFEEMGVLKGVPEIVSRHIDFESVSRDLQYGGDITYSRQGGKYFIFTPL